MWNRTFTSDVNGAGNILSIPARRDVIQTHQLGVAPTPVENVDQQRTAPVIILRIVSRFFLMHRQGEDLIMMRCFCIGHRKGIFLMSERKGAFFHSTRAKLYNKMHYNKNPLINIVRGSEVYKAIMNLHIFAWHICICRRKKHHTITPYRYTMYCKCKGKDEDNGNYSQTGIMNNDCIIRDQVSENGYP